MESLKCWNQEFLVKLELCRESTFRVSTVIEYLIAEVCTNWKLSMVRKQTLSSQPRKWAWLLVWSGFI